MYIRHGDKGIEMSLVETYKYWEAAVTLHNNGLVSGSHSTNITIYNGSGRVDAGGSVFIGSENASAIAEFESYGRRYGWDIRYTNLFDRNEVTANLDFITKNSYQRNRTSLVHHDLEYLSMLLNIDYHLKGSAFVCTIKSNFCRVIDELRAALAGKANRYYVDLSCSEGMCMNDVNDTSW